MNARLVVSLAFLALTIGTGIACLVVEVWVRLRDRL